MSESDWTCCANQMFPKEAYLKPKRQVAAGRVKQSKCLVHEKATKSRIDEEDVCRTPGLFLRYSVPFEMTVEPQKNNCFWKRKVYYRSNNAQRRPVITQSYPFPFLVIATFDGDPLSLNY